MEGVGGVWGVRGCGCVGVYVVYGVVWWGGGVLNSCKSRPIVVCITLFVQYLQFNQLP